MIFEGAISVKAILSNHKRQINCLYLKEGKDDRNTRYIIELAKKQEVTIKYLPEAEINQLATGFTHGGILLDAEARTYKSVTEIMVKHNFIAIIDGIEDPFNLGYAMRSLYAFGATAFIICNRNLAKFEPNILKSSAGAYENLKIAKSSDLKADIELLKQQHVKVYALQRNPKAVALEAVKFSNNMAFIVGGEKRGISKDILKTVDEMVYITYANNFRNALNASSAITTFGYAKYLQALSNKKMK